MKVGQQVLAVSDPGYQGQMLSLKTKPSKMALTRAVSQRERLHDISCGHDVMSTTDLANRHVAMRQNSRIPLILIS